MKNKLKKLIIKRVEDSSRNHGMDLDGDIFEMFGKRYYVDILNDTVKEIK